MTDNNNNTKATTASFAISQDYFDELCRENADVFELSADDAVAETVTQLTASSSSARALSASASSTSTANNSNSNSNGAALSHLLQSHPDSEIGQQERDCKMAFVQAMNRCLDTTISDTTTDTTTTLVETLQFVQDCLLFSNPSESDTTKTTLSIFFYQNLFVALSGWKRSFDLLERLVQSNNNNDNDCTAAALTSALVHTLSSLVTTTTANTNNRSLCSIMHRRALQTTMLPVYMVSWLHLLQQTLQSVNTTNIAADATDATSTTNITLLLDTLVVLQTCTQQNERNKQLFTSPALEKAGAPVLLLLLVQVCKLVVTVADVASVDDTNDDNSEHVTAVVWSKVARAVARLIATLGTFEEDWMVSDNDSDQKKQTVVASAHATVLALSEIGAVVQLVRLWTAYPTEPCAVASLRCMAIHDSVVQQMVAAGVLERVLQTFQQDKQDNESNIDKERTNEYWAGRTAVIGLVRNLCANDEIKCTLCGGRQSIVVDLIRIMNEALSPDNTRTTTAGTRNHGTLLEHACGVIAAMALRFARNAELLVKNLAVEAIVRSMYKYPDKVPLQRQAALAIRNIVSRDTDLRAAVLQAGAEAALTGVAARHVRCQDEVYAALRDLGIAASLRAAEQDSSGNMVLKDREMFGTRNPNFRPVFE